MKVLETMRLRSPHAFSGSVLDHGQQGRLTNSFTHNVQKETVGPTATFRSHSLGSSFEQPANSHPGWLLGWLGGRCFPFLRYE